MKMSRYRTHKVNVGNYENVEFGASVTIDTDVDLDGEPAIEFLNKKLDELLEEDMREAVANVPAGDSTHVETWRK